MTGPADLSYPGRELELFAHARNWKTYWRELVLPYLKGDVLEVGAGIGTNTNLLRTNAQTRWVCLEPDGKLLEQARTALKALPAPPRYEAVHGTVADLSPTERFDAIVYLDVLEHIGDDAGELRRAAEHLKPHGRLIVLSPAHQWLFCAFDAAIGHFRRYTRASLAKAAGSSGLQAERLLYLDCCGLLTSLANRVLLRQSLPTQKQILFWDRTLVPVSRRCDRFFGYRMGKSILGIWANNVTSQQQSSHTV
jgi:SAM-dependent methyltransferase